MVVLYLMTSHTNTVPPEGTNPEGTNLPNPQGTIFVEAAVKSLKYMNTMAKNQVLPKPWTYP